MQGKWISKLVSYQKLESLIGTHNSMDTEIVNLQRGAFILSLDVELAWGSVHRNKLAQREKYFVETRSNIQRLLKILERYQIHATWAVIGHLFLDRCLPVNGINHPEIIRPINQDGEDWFLQDPCSTLQDSPIWYGSDIIQQIVNCSVHQEIGCHTFSHVQAGGPGCGPECFDSELRACRVEAEKLKLELKSFVFPRNEIGYLDILKWLHSTFNLKIKDVRSKNNYAINSAIKLRSDMRRKITCRKPVNSGPFRLHRRTLGFRDMLRHFLNARFFFLPHRTVTQTTGPNQSPVHEQICIPSNRGGKMRIVLQSQSKMPDIIR